MDFRFDNVNSGAPNEECEGKRLKWRHGFQKSHFVFLNSATTLCKAALFFHL